MPATTASRCRSSVLGDAEAPRERYAHPTGRCRARIGGCVVWTCSTLAGPWTEEFIRELMQPASLYGSARGVAWLFCREHPPAPQGLELTLCRSNPIPEGKVPGSV